MRVSMRFTIAILLIAMAMMTLSQDASVSAQAQEEQRYLIIASSGLPPALDFMLASVGGRLVESMEPIGVAVAASSEPMFQAAAWGLPGIQAVVPDATTTVDSVGAEVFDGEAFADEGVAAEGSAGPPINALQWNLRAIKAKEAWNAALGAGAVVAVLDSGIDAGHPAFLSRNADGQLVTAVDTAHSKSYVCETMAPGPACTAPGSPESLRDLGAHGTHVAGIIAARSGFPGVAPQAKLISVKVLNQNGEGNEGDVIAGIVYAADAGANVINMSLGFTFAVNDWTSAQQLAALNRAVNYAFAKGSLVVASVGNDASDLDRNRNMVKAPAQITHVIAVSGTGPLYGQNPDTFATIYSDYGSSAVFVAAPGGNLEMGWVTDPDTDKPKLVRLTPPSDMVIAPCSRQAEDPNLAVCRPDKGPAIVAPKKWAPMALAMAGTSMAAAHVSGLAALLVSKFGGAITASQLRAIIQQTADDLGKPGKDQFFGYGRIDAYRAVTGK